MSSGYDELYDVTIVMSVTDGHWRHASQNVILTERQNPRSRIKWVLVANNHDPEFQIPQTVLDNPNVALVEGFSFEQFAHEPRPASSSLSTALALGFSYVETRFCVELDSDFFIIFPNWVQELIRHMKEDNLGVWGAPWHIKRSEKWRDFPCSHMSMFDREVLPLDKLDFQPEYGAYFEFTELPAFCRTWLYRAYLDWLLRQELDVLELNLEVAQSQEAQLSGLPDPLKQPALADSASDADLAELRAAVRHDALMVDHRQWVNKNDLQNIERDRLTALLEPALEFAEAVRVRYERSKSGVYDLQRALRLQLERTRARITNLERTTPELRIALDDVSEKLGGGVWRDRLTRPLASWLERASGPVRDWVFKRYGLWVKRVQIGQSADCNVRIYRYCRTNRVRSGMAKISICLEDYGFHYAWPLWRQIKFLLGVYAEQLLPSRYNLRPLRHAASTRDSFAGHGLPDFRGAGWEEYFWRGKPFSVHIRSTARRFARPQSEVQEAWLANFLVQAIGREIVTRNKLDPKHADPKTYPDLNEAAGNPNAAVQIAHMQQDAERLRSYADKHKGERCFIVVNGPSLKVSDLDLLENETCFACNKIYLLYEQTKWRPKYFMCEDIMVLRQNIDRLSALTGSTKFFPRRLFNGEGFLPRHSPDAIYYDLLFPDWRRKHTHQQLFSLDPVEGLNMGGTVLYSMIEMAAYMGFKDIYLLGCDLTFDMRSENPVHRLRLEVGQHINAKDLFIFITHNGYMDQGGVARRLQVSGDEVLEYPGDFVHHPGADVHEFYLRSRLGDEDFHIVVRDHRVASIAFREASGSNPAWETVNERAIPGLWVTSRGHQNHFAESYRKPSEIWSAPNMRTIHKALGIADKATRQRGQRIFNATRGGRVEAFERVRLEDVLAVGPEAGQRSVAG
jgi:hypothetical protein